MKKRKPRPTDEEIENAYPLPRLQDIKDLLRTKEDWMLKRKRNGGGKRKHNGMAVKPRNITGINLVGVVKLQRKRIWGCRLETHLEERVHTHAGNAGRRGTRRKTVL